MPKTGQPPGETSSNQPLSEFSEGLAPDRIGDEDAVAFLARFPDASVDIVITDPPYESIRKYKRVIVMASGLKDCSKWLQIFPNKRFEELFSEIYRVLKNDTHFYLFCDAETMFVVKPIAEACGFTCVKPIVWDKVTSTMTDQYRVRQEYILFFEKGKRTLFGEKIPNILTEKPVNMGYPTEKPLPLLKTLLRQSSLIGQIVVDPFCGAGGTGVAAALLERVFFGNDIYLEAREVAAERIGRVRDDLM